MRRTSVVVTLGLLGVALAWPRVAAAQQEVESLRCESHDNSHNECRYSSTGIVTVHVKQQLSSARCVFGESWGSFDGGVWVDYGCRAEFSVRRPSQTPAYRPAGGQFSSVTCESRDGKRRECPLANLDVSSVYMERPLSRATCERGRNWDATSRGIWVDHGCRAIFAYLSRGGAARTPYGGTQYDHDVPCESLRGEWVHCEVRDVHVARVERIAGNSQCDAYKAWGVDDTGIWVRSECQGVFKVNYRH